MVKEPLTMHMGKIFDFCQWYLIQFKDYDLQEGQKLDLSNGKEQRKFTIDGSNIQMDKYPSPNLFIHYALSRL